MRLASSASGVNEPPPGWTAEADRAEEEIAMRESRVHRIEHVPLRRATSARERNP